MWIEVVPFALMTLGILVIPGTLIGLASGLQLRAAILFSPLGSVATAAMAAIAANLLGIGWGLLPMLVMTAIVTGAGFGATKLLTRISWLSAPGEDAPTRTTVWWTVAGVGVTAVIMVVRGIQMIGSPDWFSQTYDNVYHLSAVRWILDTGNGSSLKMGVTSTDGSGYFYPSAWHDVVSLCLRTMGSDDVVTGTNGLVLVAISVVWAFGCIALAVTLFRDEPLVLAATGALAPAFAAFPHMLVGYGVLYPNLLGLCLLPSLLALMTSLLGFGTGPRIQPAAALTTAVIGMIGAGLVHPNVALTVISVVGIVAIAAWAAPQVRELIDAGRLAPLGWLRIGFAVVWIATAIGLFLVIRPVREVATWGPQRSMLDAMIESVTISPMDATIPLLGSGLALVGLVIAWRSPKYKVIALIHLLLVFLWLVAGAQLQGAMRYLFVGPWYNDNYRLGAMLPVTAVPLAVLAVVTVVQWLLGWGRLQRVATSVWVPVVVAGLIVPATQLDPNQAKMVEWVRDRYEIADDSPLVTADEYQVIMNAAQVIPEGEQVVVNPWNGSSMIYPLTGVQVLEKHIPSSSTPEQRVITQDLNEITTNPKVCEVLKARRAMWVLDFGQRQMINNTRINYPGWRNLASTPGFELVDRHGDASLYRVVACG